MVGASGLAVDGEAVEEEAAEAADEAAAVGEGERIADDHPQHRDQAGDAEALHHGGEDVHLAHHAGVEQRQARHGHQQHQGRRGQHPGGVAAIERRGIGPGRHRDDKQGSRQEREEPARSGHVSISRGMTRCPLTAELRAKTAGERCTIRPNSGQIGAPPDAFAPVCPRNEQPRDCLALYKPPPRPEDRAMSLSDSGEIDIKARC